MCTNQASQFFSGHQINLSSLRNKWSLHLDAVLTLTLINRIVDSEQWHWSTENSAAAERAGCLMYCTWCSGTWVHGHCVFCQIRISAWLSLIVKKCHVEDVLESGKRALYILSNQNVCLIIIYCKANYKGGRENESLKFIDNWQKNDQWTFSDYWWRKMACMTEKKLRYNQNVKTRKAKLIKARTMASMWISTWDDKVLKVLFQVVTGGRRSW